VGEEGDPTGFFAHGNPLEAKGKISCVDKKGKGTIEADPKGGGKVLQSGRPRL